MYYLREIRKVLDAEMLGENLHPICCGAQSVLWLAVLEAAAAGTEADDLCQGVLRDLEAQALPLLANHPARWSRCVALLNVIRAFLGYDAEDKPLGQAAQAFQESWRGPVPELGEHPAQALADDGLEEAHRSDLNLGTVVGWLTYDALWHLKHSQPGALADVGQGGLLAREAIPALFTRTGMDSGLVLHLVTEILAGPAGLVTPDWWPMGLVEFPPPPSEARDAEDRKRFADFLLATQRVMRAVAARMNLAHRLRWRLEYRQGDDNPWNRPITGRSAEAAAAVVARAVCEAVSSGQKSVLEPDASITACVQDLDDPKAEFDFHKAVLEKVDDNSLRFKLAAAQQAGLTTVFVATDQGPKPLEALAAQFQGRFPETRATLEEAYEDLLYDNRFVVAYRQHEVSKWKDQWSEEETPREPGQA
jgi:hypothetical protein